MCVCKCVRVHTVSFFSEKPDSHGFNTSVMRAGCVYVCLFFFSFFLSFSSFSFFSFRCSKPNLPPSATSENCAGTRLTGCSFVDPGNSFNMLDEIDDMNNEGYVPDHLNRDWIEGRFQQRFELMLK